MNVFGIVTSFTGCVRSAHFFLEVLVVKVGLMRNVFWKYLVYLVFSSYALKVIIEND